MHMHFSKKGHSELSAQDRYYAVLQITFTFIIVLAY